MGKITPVPNGHLIKKDGTALKNGGKVAKKMAPKMMMKTKKK